MFGFLKSLWGETRSAKLVPKSSTPIPAPAERPSQSRQTPPAARPVSEPAEEGLLVPLKAVVDRMPATLRERVVRTATDVDVVALPLSKVVAQLPRGEIRMSFRELKKAVPSGTFSTHTEMDETVIQVPLREVLPRLKPEHLARRTGQQQVMIPDDVGCVFTPRRGQAENGAAPASTSQRTLGTDELRESRAISQLPKPSPLSPPSPAPEGPTRTAPAAAPAGGKAFPAVTLSRASSRAPGSSAPAAPRSSLPGPALPAATSATGPSIQVALISVARHWPDPLRREILGRHLSATLQIPFTELEAAMKRGKAVFHWKQIRSWIVPKIATTLSEHDLAPLELPLPILTPLFLAQRPAAAERKKAVVSGDLPDIFAAKPAREKASSAQVQESAPMAAPPVDSVTLTPPAPRPDLPLARAGQAQVEPPAPALAMRPDQSPGGAFADLSLRTRSARNDPEKSAPGQAVPAGAPAEVVARACELSSVAGALLATGDGLVVASRLPSAISAEVMAGFLPEIHRRLSEYTKELKLGAPSHIELVVESMPWQIMKAGTGYFSVLGKPGEVLPKAPLAALAAQLSHRIH